MPSFWPVSLIAISSLFGWLTPMPAIPADHEGLCRTMSAGGVDYMVCEIDLDHHRLHLLAEDEAGKPFETFEAAERALAQDGRTLHFAMNAGMYHEDRRPVGLAVQDGREVQEISTADGPGNFSMKPNGVFFVENGRARVMDTAGYLAEPRAPELATQSGPMLLIEGERHPRFIEGSDSRYVRNGVCAAKDGRSVSFVISRRPVNFWDFAGFFRDGLKCRNALFFDGQVSSFRYPALDIDYRRDRLGPILAVTDR